MVYFFIHTPKTSGTTFTKVLEKDKNNHVAFFYPPKSNMIEFEDRIKEGPHYHKKSNPSLEKFTHVVGHFTFGIHETFNVSEYKYIGVYRDPIKHYVSMYKNFLRMDENFQKIIMPAGVSFDNLLDLEYARNMQAFFISGLSLKEIKKDPEKAFQISIENIEKYFAGLYPTEKFEEGLFYFSKKIGVKPFCFKKSNVSKNLSDHELTNIQIEKIQEISSIDFRLYDYLEKKFNDEFNNLNIEGKVKMFKAKNFLYNLF
jgi:hypothetical protein